MKPSTAYIVPSQKLCPVLPTQSATVKSFPSFSSKDFSAHLSAHAWHSHTFLFVLKPISQSFSLILLFFPILYSCTYTKIVYFQLNIFEQSSASTYRNNRLILDKLYMMKSFQSLLLNQVEIYLQSLRQNNPLRLGHVELQLCSSIRFCISWSQNKNVAEIKLFEGSVGISTLSLK